MTGGGRGLLLACGLLVAHAALALVGAGRLFDLGTAGPRAVWLALWGGGAGLALWGAWRGWADSGWAVRGLLGGAVLALVVEGVWAFQGDPDAALPRLQVTAQGRAVRIEGAWQSGDAQRVEALLRAHPQVVRLELQGGGLAWGEALALREVVHARRLDTQLIGPCEQACALVFLSGPRRQALPEGGLRLVRLPDAFAHPLARWGLRLRMRHTLDALALPAPLRWTVLHSGPSSRAQLPRDTLWQTGVLTRAGGPLDVDLPPVPGDAVAEYQAALRAHPVWHALEQRVPGVQVRVAETMHRARQLPEGDVAAWRVAQEAAYAHLPHLLRHTDPVERLRYVALLTDLASAAPDPTSCRGVFSAAAAPRATLPVDLLVREAQWMAEASGGPTESPRPLRPLEREVLVRTLGAPAVAQLSRLWGESAGALPCAEALALLRQVQRLPVPQQKLAARLLF